MTFPFLETRRAAGETERRVQGEHGSSVVVMAGAEGGERERGRQGKEEGGGEGEGEARERGGKEGEKGANE